MTTKCGLAVRYFLAALMLGAVVALIIISVDYAKLKNNTTSSTASSATAATQAVPTLPHSNFTFQPTSRPTSVEALPWSSFKPSYVPLDPLPPWTHHTFHNLTLPPTLQPTTFGTAFVAFPTTQPTPVSTTAQPSSVNTSNTTFIPSMAPTIMSNITLSPSMASTAVCIINHHIFTSFLSSFTLLYRRPRYPHTAHIPYTPHFPLHPIVPL